MSEDEFDTDFPSLEGKGTNDAETDCMNELIFHCSVIQECCQDNQKVKEAIEKFKTRSNNRWTDEQVEDFLKKELNL